MLRKEAKSWKKNLEKELEEIIVKQSVLSESLHPFLFNRHIDKTIPAECLHRIGFVGESCRWSPEKDGLMLKK